MEKETPLSLARQLLHGFLGIRELKLITHMKAVFTCIWELVPLAFLSIF